MKYRLKKEARQFFNNYKPTLIQSLEEWQKDFVGINFLEKVENVYVEYGKSTSPNSKDLCGHDHGKSLSKYWVEINVIEPHEKYEEKDIPELMDYLQKALTKYFKNK